LRSCGRRKNLNQELEQRQAAKQSLDEEMTRADQQIAELQELSLKRVRALYAISRSRLSKA